MTTPNDAAQVLAKCACFDPTFSRPDPAIAIAWAEAFNHHKLELHDLLNAVTRHYADTPERAMPATIIRQARELRRQRAEHEKATGTTNTNTLDPKRQAIAQCNTCDPNGWIEINGQAHRCNHTKQLGETA